jgi:hypothetical protein
MTTTRRRSRIDTVLALIDECLAEYEQASPAAHRTSRSHS